MNNPLHLLVILGLMIVSGTSSARSLPVKGLSNDMYKHIIIGAQDVYFIKNEKNLMTTRFVMSGLFPNSCYSFDNIDIEHTDTHSHRVKMSARVVQSICMMVLVPYTVEGDLGPLEPGKHSVKFLSGDGTYFEKTISIESTQ